MSDQAAKKSNEASAKGRKSLRITVLIALFLTAGVYAVFLVVQRPMAEALNDPPGRDLVEEDFASVTDCEKQKLSILEQGVAGPLTVDHLTQAKGACAVDQHPGERELNEADFAAASPCVRDKLRALLDNDLSPVLTVDDRDAAQYWCERESRIDKQRSALEATTQTEK